MSQRPLPAGVYWRRRLVLLAGVIAVAWVALQVLGGGDDDAAPRARTTATTTAPVVPAAKTDGVVSVALAGASAPCDPEQVRVTPSARPGQTTRAPVDIGLVVSSTARTACTLTPDDAELLAVIGANGTPIWDSTVCKVSLLDEDVPLSPRWSTLVTVQWSGRGSGSTCSPKEGWATPGTYTVQVGTLGGEPGRASFSLEAKPTPKPEDKPKKGSTSKPADEKPGKPTPERTTAKPAD